jgi:D-xylose transport system substrate-binding protein
MKLIRPMTFAIAALTLTTAGCSSGAAAPAGAGAAAGPAKNIKIAFLMPCSACADRFESQDKPLFIAAVKALDPTIEVIANNAQGNSATQVSQTESALTNGAKVIVVSPLDESAGAAISDKAAAAKVPVVSYDGLITGAKSDFYVSFDNVKVGEAQGQFLADKLPAGANVVMINGDQTIAPGRDFKNGAHKVLDPLFKSGKLKLAYESDTAQFDPAKGQASMEQALTKLGDKVDAVLVPNDGLAGAVINALIPRKLAGKVLVTGQDATDAGLQRVLLGQQSMTVYKALKAEAEAAAKVAVALAKGQTSEAMATATSSVDNGAGKVPSLLLSSVSVTSGNIASTVFADKFTTPEKVCTGDAAGKCPAS